MCLKFFIFCILCKFLLYIDKFLYDMKMVKLYKINSVHSNMLWIFCFMRVCYTVHILIVLMTNHNSFMPQSNIVLNSSLRNWWAQCSRYEWSIESTCNVCGRVKFVMLRLCFTCCGTKVLLVNSLSSSFVRDLLAVKTVWLTKLLPISKKWLCI